MTTVEEATSDWLTHVLQQQGYLDSGAVSDVSVDAEKSSNASTARLALTYSREATGVLPTNLFLKLCNVDTGHFGNSEICYYTAIATQIQDPPIPHCYHCAYTPDTGHYHLLLQDVSQTHASNWNVKPAWESAAKTVDAMAKIHASWWNHSLLSTVGKFPNEEVIENYISYPAQGLSPMLDDVGKTLPQPWLDLIHHIFHGHGDQLKKRASRTKTLTCIHGDLNPGNILSPIDASGNTLLIDRQLFEWSLSVWLGVSDIAYMMVHWWDTGIRRQLEKPLLQRYHQKLEELGIEDYSFAELWSDYRLCAMQSLYVVTAWCISESERREYKWVWLPQLKKTMAACLDLECIELLQ
ncbi:hypothetical protein H6F88_00085 [Oculatella sp. FACHB-28]|uniref:hypothetical protein n=1 Tax=Oculatella sp. FACHB-28 TaxID=2692845 RepID=UPI0019B15AED|nr:hypothetical protein [Oculatella sp. FACHB-28]MBD2054451.1 hypothetical protein [Oculatella sp. FACHB-28]